MRRQSPQERFVADFTEAMVKNGTHPDVIVEELRKLAQAAEGMKGAVRFDQLEQQPRTLN